MSVNDPFAPSIYVPNPTNTNPASASQGWAQGISSIGNALFPNPTAMAEVRLRGAQTQQAQAQTQLLQNQAQARTTLQGIMGGDPNSLADPANRAAYTTAMTALPPEEQAQARNNFALILQNSNLPEDVKNHYTSGAGITNYTQTPTGVNADLQNRIQTSTIGANATVAAAGETAGAMVASERIRDAGETYRQTQNPVSVLGPTGPEITTQGTATGGGFTPLPQTPQDAATLLATQSQAGVQPKSSFAPPSHGTSPQANVTQPTSTNALPANTTGSPNGGGNFGQTWLSNINRSQTSNLPKEDIGAQINLLAARDIGKATFGTAFQLGPNINNAVQQRANQYLLNQQNRGTYNNPKASAEAAWGDVVTPYLGQLTYNQNQGSRLPPVVDYPPGFNFNNPPAPKTPLPPAAATPTPPLPSTGQPRVPFSVPTQAPSSMFAPRQAAAATPAPAPAPAPAPTPTPLAAVPAAKRVPNRLVFQGNLYLGGAPGSATSWRAATPAEIAAAQSQGFFVP